MSANRGEQHQFDARGWCKRCGLVDWAVELTQVGCYAVLEPAVWRSMLNAEAFARRFSLKPKDAAPHEHDDDDDDEREDAA